MGWWGGTTPRSRGPRAPDVAGVKKTLPDDVKFSFDKATYMNLEGYKHAQVLREQDNFLDSQLYKRIRLTETARTAAERTQNLSEQKNQVKNEEVRNKVKQDPQMLLTML